MKTLVELLTEQTQSLKTQFIEKTEEWANSEFDRLIEMTKWTDEQWCKYLRIIPVMSNSAFRMPGDNGRLTFPKGFYNTRLSGEYLRKRDKAWSAWRQKRENFVAKAVKMAEDHYESSIQKLAYRIEKKELNQDTLKMITSHIGVNIETTITDGVKTVRAFTVLAVGEIQRPHYRYLVK